MTAIPGASAPDAPRPPRWPKDPPPRVAASPAIARLTGALRNGAVADALARFWSAAAERGAPLVDPAPGAPGERIVTFLWRDRHGTGEGTRAVLLVANKLTDPSVPEQSSLERLSGTDVWHRALRLPSAWRGTYALAADDDGAPLEDAALGPASRWRGLAARTAADPLNPRTFPGSRGGAPLSVLELPDAPPQPYASRPVGARPGSVTEHLVPGGATGRERRAWVHRPIGTPDVPHRLLVLLDGDEWTGRRDAPAILDALHHAGRIPPLVTLMVDGGGTADRWRDMTAGAPYLDLLGEVLPRWARERWPVGDDREHVILAGQSLGGLAVLRAAIHAPSRVGAVISQSASLWWPDQEGPRAPSAAVEELRSAPPLHARFHVEVGRDEWVLLHAHRALRDVLRARGDRHRYVEYEGGHDALCWRGGLADGLIAVTEDAG